MGWRCEVLGRERVREGGDCLPSGVVCVSGMVDCLMLDAIEILGSEDSGQCLKDVVI